MFTKPHDLGGTHRLGIISDSLRLLLFVVGLSCRCDGDLEKMAFHKLSSGQSLHCVIAVQQCTIDSFCFISILHRF